jgi:hypothetical protein
MEEEVTEYETRNAVEIEPGIFNCEILHPSKGWLPFTSAADDTEAHGKAIHAHFKAGTRPTRPMTAVEAQARATMKREVFSADARFERDRLLTATDWQMQPDISPPLSPTKKAALTTYRTALRNVPQQAGFPETIVWPTPPT